MATCLEKVDVSPKPFVSFGLKKKPVKIPNSLGPYIVTSKPPPRYAESTTKGLKYTYSVYTPPPGLRVTVRPHAYPTAPDTEFFRPSQYSYQIEEDDHDKKFDVINKFTTDFR